MTTTRKPELNETMTPQSLFDTAYWGVIEQGRPATGVTGTCVYRTAEEDGPVLQCALGQCLTSDEIDAFESECVTGLVSIDIEDNVLPVRISQNYQLSCDMQSAHDGASAEVHVSHTEAFIAEFKFRMGCVATKYGLAVPR